MVTNSARLILSVSRDERLLRSRQMVLESQGWHVITATHPVEALLWLADRGFDAAVLDHSIAPAERVSLAQKIKHFAPNVPIVIVCKHGDNAFSNTGADACVGSLDGPVVLINTIRRLTRIGEQEIRS